MGILDGKVAIVTGASRGIGAEIARRFAAEGAAVAVAARTTDQGTSPFPGTIAETVDQIRTAGGTASAIRAAIICLALSAAIPASRSPERGGVALANRSRRSSNTYVVASMVWR